MRLFAKDLLKSNMPKVETSEWSTPTQPTNTINFSDFMFDTVRNKFVGVGGRYFVETSDGVTLSKVEAFATNDSALRRISHKARGYIALCLTNYNGTSYYAYSVSSDSGQTWTTPTRFSTSGSWKNCVFTDIEYGSSTIIAVGYKKDTGKGFYTKCTNNASSTSYSWSTPIEFDVTIKTDSSNNTTKPRIKRVNNFFYVVGFGEYIGCGGSYGEGPYNNGWYFYNVGNNDDCYWQDITYGNGKFVIMSSDGFSSLSTESEPIRTTDWTEPRRDNNNYSTNYVLKPSLTYGAKQFFAVGSGGSSTHSLDGYFWRGYKFLSDRPYWDGVAYGNDKVMAVNDEGYISYKTWKEKE